MRILFVIFASLLALSSATSVAADVWIFSGQSNMQKIGSSAQRAVGQIVEKHKRDYLSIYAAAPGKPIEAWLDPQHKDYKLWMSLEEQITKTNSDSENQFKGFVWYQGESNVKPHAGKYQDQLTELVKRVRQITGQPQLPVIIVQIGAATSYSGKDWAAATVREAQRRFARDDKHAAVVAAVDVQIGDYTVHLSKEGAELVSERIAAAADRLAYGNENAHWGPQFKSAYFATRTRREVVVEFDGVEQKIKLGEGWMAGFGVSTKTTFPEPLSQLDDAEQLGQLADDFIYPSSGGPLDARRLIFVFDQPLPPDARLCYAAARNAQYGPYRRWGLEFGGVQDESGHQAPAFVLVPISESKQAIVDPSAKLTSFIKSDWEQIAVNCVGRFPAAVTSAKAEAGIEQNDWRQSYWNPASAGLVPNLFDKGGYVTPVNFHTGVWYMSPYFRELKNADDALMASWCKHKQHAFSGLTPHAKYDLAIYLLQGPPRKKVDNPPSHRPVRVSVFHIPKGKKRKDAKLVTQRTAHVPADGSFEGYQIASPDSDAPANVVVLQDITANDQGRIELAIETAEQKGDRLRWGETTLAGVQIRRK